MDRMHSSGNGDVPVGLSFLHPGVEETGPISICWPRCEADGAARLVSWDL